MQEGLQKNIEKRRTAMNHTLEKGCFDTIAKTVLQKRSKRNTKKLEQYKSAMEYETVFTCTRRTASLHDFRSAVI